MSPTPTPAQEQTARKLFEECEQWHPDRTFYYADSRTIVPHVAALIAERDAARAELLDEHCFNEGLQEHVCDLMDAMKPFVELVKGTSGRIPVEQLSFANWHKLSKAFNAAHVALAAQPSPEPAKEKA